MDVVEGQSLQLHIGRLGEGGCAAQMGWLGNSYMSGNVVGETRRGVRRRCSVILQSMDKQKVARQRKRPPPHLWHRLAWLHLEGLLGRILAGSAQSCSVLSLEERSDNDIACKAASGLNIQAPSTIKHITQTHYNY